MNQNPNAKPNANMNPNQAPKPMNQGPQPIPNQPMPNKPQAMPMNGQMPPNGARPNNVQQFVKQGPNNQPAKKKKNPLSKELVTIVGVILIVGILYFSYNYTINKNLEISANIPVAATRILPGHKLTEQDIKYIDVPASTLRTIGAVTDAQQILNRYVIYDTVIPEGSFFYATVLSETNQSPDSIFENLDDDQVAITIDVDLLSTYGNSIMPGNKVDIYAKANRINKKGEVEYIIGPLVTQAEVLAVKDGSGNDVFADHQNKLTPSFFMFAMPSDIATIMQKAKLLAYSEYSVELFPVITGKFDATEYDTVLSQNEIKDMIENATVAIQEEANE